MLQKGVFKKVYFGGPVGGGLPENKNPTKQCAGWEKNGKYKKSNQKNVFHILYRVFSYFKNYSPI